MDPAEDLSKTLGRIKIIVQRGDVRQQAGGATPGDSYPSINSPVSTISPWDRDIRTNKVPREIINAYGINCATRWVTALYTDWLPC